MRPDGRTWRKSGRTDARIEPCYYTPARLARRQYQAAGLTVRPGDRDCRAGHYAAGQSHTLECEPAGAIASLPAGRIVCDNTVQLARHEAPAIGSAAREATALPYIGRHEVTE